MASECSDADIDVSHDRGRVSIRIRQDWMDTRILLNAHDALALARMVTSAGILAKLEEES